MGDGSVGEAEQTNASQYATPWARIAGVGVGPFRCPRCRRPVAEAARGEHACRCGEAEEGCGKAAKIRARLDGVAADVDKVFALAERLQVERDAVLMALSDEQEMARRDLIDVCKMSLIWMREAGRSVARACASAHRWRVRAARKTAEGHKVRREMSAEIEELKKKLASERLKLHQLSADVERDPVGKLMLDYRAEARDLADENATLRADNAKVCNELAAARERIPELERGKEDVEEELSRVRFLSQEVESEFSPLNCVDIGMALEELVKLRAEARALDEENLALKAEIEKERGGRTDLASVVRVGVAVILRDGAGRILMGRRKVAVGDGEWSVPGGKIERGESPWAAAARELREETGIEDVALRMLRDWTSDNGHPTWPDYVTLWAFGRAHDGIAPQLREPEKCSEWRWVSKDEIDDLSLFRCFATLLECGHDPWTVGK